ncbi:MAG: phytanoyl-CoA dioxygenase family protein [Planctomycetaceae bacterium]|jgi:ectoine hydroxylase|nr:phytanoyl-CoA dioxygenase family protein [Planctomycetaceae bacterium]MBT6155917.1 phytanoyl-CoA dioxygenase family protein [Planctomycetaceae bacterium]MBT6483168.1 phytanoyl-CoA dioxygenase family protein [Planctomycetaceae bacterium]MBT6495172.1 phytanoyl-CoA dioxygenase family protein [Planctomycetaceae bacterium]
MAGFRASDEHTAAFERDGFFVAPSLLDSVEIGLLADIARADREIATEAYGRADGEGGAVKLLVRNELAEDDIYGAIVRSERIVRTMQRVLDDEVYHYHNKMILKEAKVGGAWAWHQDYGYWYDNGCLLPDMASCLIAVDRATQENGCLQVLAGSHRMGRVNHLEVGDQTGADPERVEAARERFELIHCELQPGDGIFFHANLLHRSDQNHSNHPRWAFICCYNTRRNDPYKESRHPRYSPLDVWPDERIQLVGDAQWRRMQDYAK